MGKKKPFLGFSLIYLNTYLFSNPFFEIGVTFCSCYGPGEKSRLQTPQLDPAKSQQLPSGPLHGCQHASSSPISVEGNIAHAVLIKR